jgi:hypothetical protein
VFSLVGPLLVVAVGLVLVPAGSARSLDRAGAHVRSAAKQPPKKAKKKHAAVRAAADTSANLLQNASFEGSLAGWTGYRASVALVQNGVVGSLSARVALNTRDTSNGFAIVPSSAPVAATQAGASYTAGGWVKGARSGQTLCLKIRELSGGSEVGSAQSCLTSNGAWQPFAPVRYKAVASGRQLDASVLAWYVKKNDSFFADGLSLTSDAPAAVPSPSTTTTATTTTTTTATTTTTTTGTTTTAPAPPPSPPSAGLTATAVDNSHIRLVWGAVPGAASYRVSRDSLVVGTTSALMLTDAMLWPATQYGYSVQALDAAGSPLSTLTASASTTLVPASGFPSPFPAYSVWNTPIGNAPLRSDSATQAAYVASRASSANMTLGNWGVSVAEAHTGDPTYSVPCLKYTCTLSAFGPIAIPVTAKPEPSGDADTAIVDPAAQREWDMWQPAITSSGSWTASAGAALSTAGNAIAPAGTASGDAANFPLLGGLVRPEEILQGHIDHALVFGMPGVNSTGHVCPATHNDGDTTSSAAPMEGQRFQLDPTIDVNALPIPAWKKTIARALQVYGMYLRDSGGSLAIYSENPVSRGYDAWAKVGLSGSNVSLSGIPWDKLRAISAPC